MGGTKLESGQVEKYLGVIVDQSLSGSSQCAVAVKNANRMLGVSSISLRMLQCLEKVFIPLELFHILPPYNHKVKCFLLRFYVIDQHKVAHNC